MCYVKQPHSPWAETLPQGHLNEKKMIICFLSHFICFTFSVLILLYKDLIRAFIHILLYTYHTPYFWLAKYYLIFTGLFVYLKYFLKTVLVVLCYIIKHLCNFSKIQLLNYITYND